MPLLFPSHPGLVAPLWRRWPERFDLPALCIGAMMPDLVDGAIGVGRGHLGQGIGHSFVGLVVLCVPFGVPAWFALHAVARRCPRWPSNGLFARPWNASLEAVTSALGTFSGQIVGSLAIGTLSHLASDLISHDGASLFWPLPRWHPYPAWWSEAWFLMPVPGYPQGYAFAPHFVVWCLVTVVGAWLLVGPTLRQQ